MKKKLNGAILKGTKVRIETARPETEKPALEPAETKKKDKKKKRKRDEIPGAEIGERSVKRGWTVPASRSRDKSAEKKERIEKSKFTSGPECLFKTVLPPNVASKAAVPTKESSSSSTREVKGKGKHALVHEFSKSTKYATFLRTSGGTSKAKPVVEFVKGEGWVDEDGNVVEAEKKRSSKRKKKQAEKEEDESAAQDVMDVDAESPAHNEESTDTVEPTQVTEIIAEDRVIEAAADNSTSSDSSSEDEQVVVSDGKVASKADAEVSTPEIQNETSPGVSSDSDVDEEQGATSTTSVPIPESGPRPPADASSDSESGSDTSPTPTKPTMSRLQSTPGHQVNLSIKIPAIPQSITSQNSAVHPLEALYKRAAPAKASSASKVSPIPEPATSAPSFSFFGADNDDIDIDETDGAEGGEPQVPQTPYSQRDFEWRGMRSAAPTPDTAHANKRFLWPVDGEEDDEENEEEYSQKKPQATAVKGKGKGKEVEVKATKEEKEGGGDETEFQKWFYEHRGEANRAWKKRRKVVGKEKRQRENRKRGDRV